MLRTGFYPSKANEPSQCLLEIKGKYVFEMLKKISNILKIIKNHVSYLHKYIYPRFIGNNKNEGAEDGLQSNAGIRLGNVVQQFFAIFANDWFFMVAGYVVPRNAVSVNVV